MKKEIVEVKGFEMPTLPDGRPVVPISMATKAGGFIYVSGTPPINRETGEFELLDIKNQTRLSIENIKVILETAGSSLENILKVTIFCSNSGYFSQINEVYREYFNTDAPARTFVTVGSWMMPFDLEIECVAIENSN
ncbi:MAG: enamine deaminase RidA [Rhodospirillaceae bacterium]|nr:enamine deaminase RidA [Rhodospirillaceae bacterium]